MREIESINGKELREMFATATTWLEKSASDIDALNVFPVPDGDTGTNMLLTMRSGVEEAYHGLLMVGKHPVAVVSISLPPGEVDVNVHPTKTEVRLRDEQAVIASVQKAVRNTLIELAPVPRIGEVTTGGRVSSQPQPGLWVAAGRIDAGAASETQVSLETAVPPAKSLPPGGC